MSRGGLHKPGQARPGVPGRFVGLGVPYLGQFGALWSSLWRQCLREWSRFEVVMGFRDMGLGACVRGDLGMGKGMGPRAEYEVPFLALAVQNTVPGMEGFEEL